MRRSINDKLLMWNLLCPLCSRLMLRSYIIFCSNRIFSICLMIKYLLTELSRVGLYWKVLFWLLVMDLEPNIFLFGQT